MPTVITDYLPILQKHIQHWTDAEEAHQKPITLVDGSTLDTLRDLYEEYASAQTDGTNAEVAYQSARKSRDDARAVVMPVGVQVRNAILGQVPTAPEVQALRKRLPSLETTPQKQLLALNDVAAVWAAINAYPAGKFPSLTPPLVVHADIHGTERTVTLAEFQVFIATLSQAAEAVETSEQILKQTKEERKKVQAKINPVLAAYAKMIKGLFPASSVIAKSLPKRS